MASVPGRLAHVFLLNTHDNIATQKPALSTAAARRVFERRLGLVETDVVSAVRNGNEDEDALLRACVGGVGEGDVKARVLVVVDGVREAEDIFVTTPTTFTVPDPPSAASNLALLEHFDQQDRHGPDTDRATLEAFYNVCETSAEVVQIAFAMFRPRKGTFMVAVDVSGTTHAYAVAGFKHAGSRCPVLAYPEMTAAVRRFVESVIGQGKKNEWQVTVALMPPDGDGDGVGMGDGRAEVTTVSWGEDVLVRKGTVEEQAEKMLRNQGSCARQHEQAAAG